MDIKQELAQLLSRDVEGLIASPDSLKLLKLASILLLNGGQPRTCANSIRKYFEQLKTIDMNAVERAEQVKNRTCVPKWNGLRYIKGNHYDNKNITDNEAIQLIRAGLLSKNDFEKMPDGLVIKIDSKEEPKAEVKKAAVKRSPRKK
jgi:hypothetical protein